MKGFTIPELINLLNGSYYSNLKPNKLITDFEFSLMQLKQNKSDGLCFISISNDRWNSTHGKKTNWKNGNDVVLEYYEYCDLIITEEPIENLHGKIPQIIVANSYQSLGEIAVAARQKMSNPVIAITGSVGKSSTRLLLEHMLKGKNEIIATRGNHNTQTGVPLYTAKLNTNPDIGILEISLNALNNRGNQSLISRPNVVIVTSIGEAHLSTLHSTKNVARFKSRVFAGLESDGLVIINGDIAKDELAILLEQAKKRTNRIKLYSMETENVDLYLKNITYKKYKSIITFQYKNKIYKFELKLPSAGTIANTLGALLCLAEMGYGLTSVLPKLYDYQSLDRVMQLKQVKTIDNREIDIIDDSHNAAIPSMINAIQTFKEKAPFYRGNKILVIGQVADLGNNSEELHDKLLPIIESAGANYIFGYGYYMRKIIRKLPSNIVGGWFNNAILLSNRIPLYCKDDSLVLLKGSVSGGDFRTVSHLFPSALQRSNKMVTSVSQYELARVLQPSPGAILYNTLTKENVLSVGHTVTKSLEGLGPLFLLYLVLKDGIRKQRMSGLSNWPTNGRKQLSLYGKPFIQGEEFSDEELLIELLETQHPSAIFELAFRYFDSRSNAMMEIDRLAEEIGVPAEAVLNLTGRYRVKEQQTFSIDDLIKIGKALSPYKEQFPVLYQNQSVKIRGVLFGELRYTSVVFLKDQLLCVSGLQSRENLSNIIRLVDQKMQTKD